MRRFIDIVSPMAANRPNLLAQLERARLDEAKAYATMMVATENAIKELGEKYDGHRSRMLMTSFQRCMQFAHSLRQDRAVWFLREVRIFYLFQLFMICAPNISPQEAQGWPEFKEKGKKLLKKCEQDFKRQTNGFPAMSGGSDMSQLVHSIEHFQGVPYQKLQTYVFEMSKDWQDIKRDLEALENEFIEKARGKLTLEPGDQIVLKLPGDYVWVKLDRAHCAKEAAAMGHCGNSPRSRSQDRILSLRHIEEVIDGVQFMKPCLTFILEADGYLSEMKGRGNDKPAEHYHDQIEALLLSEHIKGVRGGGYKPENNFSINDMEHERGEALLTHNPNLATPKEAYKRYGLTGRVLELFKTTYEQQGWLKFSEAVAQCGVTSVDRNKLNAEFPTPADLYKQEGLSDRLLNQIRIGINGAGGAYKLSFDDGSYNTYKRQWFDSQAQGTRGLKVENMKPEEMKKLFEAIPEAMMPKDRYKVQGLTEELVFECLRGVAARGNKWFAKQGMDPSEWEQRDQDRLWTTDYNKLRVQFEKEVPNEWSEDHKKTPEMLASFRWWNAKYGPTDQYSLFPELDPAVGLEDKLEFAIHTWGNGQSGDIPVMDGNGFWTIGEWGDLQEFIDAVTHKDSKLRDIVGDEDDDSYDGHYPDEDDWHVQNFDDTLSIQTLIALRQHALKLQQENDDIEDDEDDDGLSCWRDILNVLIDHDDETMDAIKNAVMTGEETGASSEKYENGQDAIQNLHPLYGSVHFAEEYRDAKGKTRVPMDTKVTFGMTTEELCKYMDRQFEEGSFDPEEFFEKDNYQHPYNGYSDYDAEAARDRFSEDCPAEIADEPNPFWPNRFPENVAKLDKMTAKQLRKQIDIILKKAQAWPNFHWTVPDGDDPKVLKDALLKLAAKYYG